MVSQQPEGGPSQPREQESQVESSASSRYKLPKRVGKRKALSVYPLQPESLQSFEHGFWSHQVALAEDDDEPMRPPHLPLARIRKLMKSDPSVHKVAADVPVVLARACEAFVAELTHRAWLSANEGPSPRKGIAKDDIVRAANQSNMYDFLIDVLPTPDAIQNQQSASRAEPRRTKSPTEAIDIPVDTQSGLDA
ncbi:hypothetical protein E5Q_05010 [Mixia osmundae IAM 14324]|uniref:Transcription factor CBF/NF-Y/archaeal histone domain-containing protein n=2 Tax=Mixia osmundae (strain CBS 9802 / IAM 14324 / JCM 22182 / KY 12970) TaxID=764103 RepID=G7E665_MIXOS|nr:hypothetical protein E5Q_05010 [Mixia osmundae IAM 14324]